MGKEIELLALPKHKIICVIDIHNQNEIKNLQNKNIDVAIEFTTPESAVDNIIKCFEQNIPVVCGTTGWHNKLQLIEEKCKIYDGTLIYSSNFSIGVNLFFYIVKQSAQLLSSYINTYNVLIEETHHTQKKDSPSGTAITIANIIIKQITNFEKWVNYLNIKPADINKIELPIISNRIENVVGNHKLAFESDIDVISIEHNAKNRKGFAYGSLMAAEFIKDKKGIYTMNDLLNIKF